MKILQKRRKVNRDGSVPKKSHRARGIHGDDWGRISKRSRATEGGKGAREKWNLEIRWERTRGKELEGKPSWMGE